NTWYHAAVTYDGSTLSLYLNGKLEASKTTTAINTQLDANGLTIGFRPDESAYWNGLIDEPAIYNRALSAAEIQAIYNARGASKGGNLIQGNMIGTNAAGTAALPNGHDGIDIVNSAGNTIGGNGAGARNFISGNALANVEIAGRGSNSNWVAGN